MSNDAPKRRAVPLPATGDIPRVGKVRLGVKVTGKNKAGEDVTYPKASDHFVVTADDAGVTNPESAESFAEVYPGEPRILSCYLPAATAEQCMEGVWRLYGTGKLKRKCDGETCDERTATGGWVEKPCVCKAQNIPAEIIHRASKNLVKNPDHCRLIFTLNVLLPGVQGVGVWQVETQSEISSRRIANWLVMMEDLMGGNLRMVPFELHLVPVNVAPDGKAKTVYVLEPRATALTQALIGSGAARQAIAPGDVSPEMPAPAADEDGSDYSYEDPPDPIDQDPGPEEERAGRGQEGESNPRAASHSEPGEETPAGDPPSAGNPNPISTGLQRLETLKAMPAGLVKSNPKKYHAASLATIRQAVVANGIEWKTPVLADDATWARVKKIVEDTCTIPKDVQETLGGES